jgi:hypothetical protein
MASRCGDAGEDGTKMKYPGDEKKADPFTFTVLRVIMFLLPGFK